MRYESELLGLMSILKSYLLKIKDRYDGLIDMDDLYQECLMNAVKNSHKPNIRNPKRFFIGVFKKTILRESAKKIKEFQRMNNMQVDEYWERGTVGLIEAIDMQVKGMKPTTRRVWSCLKTFYGDRKMVRKALNCNRYKVEYHKDKLKAVYQQVLKN